VYFISTEFITSSQQVEIDNQRYTGFHPYKIDPKFRVSVQASWRPEVGVPLYLLFAKDLGLPMVRVLSKEAYNHKVAVINDSDKTPADKSKYLAKLALLSREATVNEQGKLLVPKDLSEKAGIEPESDVVLAGRGMNFEIWSKTNFEAYWAQMTAEDQEDDLGIF
jgi:DNA-binding transcriptional regulator/RsmH inhibitor MraZ